jgi:hypothetical protein
MGDLQTGQRIWRLENKVKNLRASRDWYRRQLHLASETLRDHNIRFRFGDDQPPEDSDNEDIPVRPPASTNVKQLMWDCMTENRLKVVEQTRRYPDLFKFLTFSMQGYSSAAYNFISFFLPFPTERTLRRNFSSEVGRYQDKLSDIRNIPSIIKEQLRNLRLLQLKGQQTPEQQTPEQQIPEQQIPEQQIPEQQIPEQQIPEQEEEEEEIGPDGNVLPKIPKIPMTLCLDAFSIDLFRSKKRDSKPSKEEAVALEHLEAMSPEEKSAVIGEVTRRRMEAKRNMSDENSVFLFLLAPLDHRIRIFPIHMHSHRSGSADQFILQLYNEVKLILQANRNITLVFTSVDGDPGYQKQFDEQFSHIFGTGKSLPDFAHLIPTIHANLPLQIGDYLHFVKNARTRMEDEEFPIYMHPSKKDGVTAQVLARKLSAEKALTDFSSIGKMRDEYPLTIFTLSNAMFVGQTLGVNSFLYLLIYGLWTDALVNPHLSVAVRTFFLETVLVLMCEIYRTMDEFIGMSEKKVKGSTGLFFASRGKLRRMMLTVAGVLYGIRTYPDDLGLDRIGSHIEENYIGIIRQLSHQNNQKDRVFRATARYEYVRSRFHELSFPHHVSKRVNFGGVRLRDDGYNQVFRVDSQHFVGSLLRGLSYPTALEAPCCLEEVIDYLLTTALATPYQKARFSGDLAGSQIVARLITFHTSQNDQEPRVTESRRVTRVWNEAEIDVMRQGMLENLSDVEIFQRIDNKSLNQIKNKRRELIDGPFGFRAWAVGEFEAMLEYVKATRENWKMVEAKFSRPRAWLREKVDEALAGRY